MQEEWTQTELSDLIELKSQSWVFGAKVAIILVVESGEMDLHRKTTPEIYRGAPLNLWLNSMDI